MSVRLTPGTAVSEQEVSSYLDISRTPVREAFIHLSQDGLVEILPQRGTFISKIDTALIEENRFMRLTLERAVIRLACQDLPDVPETARSVPAGSEGCALWMPVTAPAS